MRITPEPIDGGTLVLQEIYNSLILRTSEGNELIVCMRDDTFEMRVDPAGQPPGPWLRANMQTKQIEQEESRPYVKLDPNSEGTQPV